MKIIRVPLLLLCAVIFTSAGMARSHPPQRGALNPPSWILATWTNTLESNLNRLETFAFAPGEIRFEKGFGEKRKVVDLGREFKNYQVRELVEPKLYRVEFVRDRNVVVYEFKLNDLSPGFHGQQALTYSITRKKRVVQPHSTWLFKPDPAK